jgi:sugar phosphate isomerase/epimerase
MARQARPHSPDPLSRRRFLSASAGAAASAAAISLIPAVASAGTEAGSGDDGRGGPPTVLPSHRGIILYTVRDVVSRAPDPTTGLGGGFRYVLEQLSAMGYKQVEFAGYTQSTTILGRQITPAEIRQLLDDNGLVANGSHITINFDDPDGFKAQLDIAETLGMAHLGTPAIPTGSRFKADWARAADGFNAFGQLAKERGIKLYQHNHHAEYQFLLDAGPNDANGNPTRSSGLRGLEYFFTLTDPNLVWFEMDIFWGYVARHRYQTFTDASGQTQTALFDPIRTVECHTNRFPLFHVKDGIPADNPDGFTMVPAGTGVVPLKQLLDTIGKAGFRHPNYEQDNAPGGAAAPNQSLQFSQTSYTNIAGWRNSHH